ncbi:MAG: DUF3373 domain-containing protein [Epsilonproteobacteria bacterium]|nr:DUF3373 domain-containing protein [Campylobacterota bacterium]
MRKSLFLSLAASCIVTSLSAAAPQNESNALEERLKTLEQKLVKSDKKVKKLEKKLNAVKAHDAFDNIKFSIDFRNAVESINYKYNNYSYQGTDLSGTESSNDSLLTSRLYLNMKSSPMPKLSFKGQMAVYSTWGGSHLSHDATIKDWSESSKPTDTIFRIRQAYFVWKDRFGEEGLPYAFSVGRRPATDGFLANFRENMDNPGSPLAHVTNMEVNGAMLKLVLNKYLEGSFVKFVYGRAHSGGIETLYDTTGYRPYAQEEGDVDENVDFFVMLGSLYNNGQYNLMFENATIFDTKGARTGLAVAAELPDGSGKNKSLDAGTANLTALSLQVNGIGNEINDFLDNSNAFISFAMTNYDPNSGHQLLGSTDNERGTSYWVGVSVPDMITESGAFGFEFNHGSKYWTPITWAEDTAIGSKIAVRGDAYEAYWNFDLFGVKNLSSQIRYTHVQHDYTPSIRCAGWVTPQKVDIEADNVRFFIRYTY